MNKRAVIAAISSHADDNRAMGVAHLYLFGSVARGEAKRGGLIRRDVVREAVRVF